MIAKATGEPASAIMGLAGVSQTTFVRNEAANRPLPDVAGHRIMAYLRLLTTLRGMLEESGAPEQMKTFDLEGWFARWVHDGWNVVPEGIIPRSIGSAWLTGGTSALLVVPSMINEQDNVLINPAHPDAALITTARVRQFVYDHRV
nr:RES family NAD+ phosphorylase [Duganella vulcania]